MKLSLTLLTVIVLLTSCDLRDDAMIPKRLTGTWAMEETQSNAGNFKSTITIAPDGSYACQIISDSGSNGVRNWELEGTLQVAGGVLIDTTTKHSSTNARVPFTSRARIIRLDDRELVVIFERHAGFAYPTNEVRFKKITKEAAH